MRLRQLLGLLVGCLGSTLFPTSVVAQSPAAGAPPAAPAWATATAPLVFTGVTVIDVEHGQQVPRQTVVIAGTRIQALGADGKIKVPQGARVVDARGKYLIPGLWDLHVHLHVYVDIAFPLFIANGVTGVRDAGSRVPLATLGQWKREIAAGTRLGPRYLVSGPQILQAPDSQQGTMLGPKLPPPPAPQVGFDQTHQLYVPPRLVARVVDSLRAAGADFIKTYEPMSPAMYFALAAEARRIGIPFGGHVGGHYGEPSGLDASDSGATFLDHQAWLKSAADTNLMALTAAAARLRRNNSWVTVMGFKALPVSRVTHVRRYQPASSIRPNDTVLTAAERATPEPVSSAQWADYFRPHGVRFSRLDTIQRAAGMPVVVGTDGGQSTVFGIDFTPGFSVHNALLNFVLLEGMTPLDALRTATLNPALALRATDSLGTVAAGKVADLVLLDADPLTDIWHTTTIRAVVANGRYYDRAALDCLLVQAEQAAAHR